MSPLLPNPHQLRVIQVMMTVILACLGMSRTSLAVEAEVVSGDGLQAFDQESVSLQHQNNQTRAGQESVNNLPSERAAEETELLDSKTAQAESNSVGMCGPLAQSIDAPSPLLAEATPSLTNCQEAISRDFRQLVVDSDPAELEKPHLQTALGYMLSQEPMIAAGQLSFELHLSTDNRAQQQNMQRLLRPPIASPAPSFS